MGDARYDPHYKRIREADDRARAIASMADEDVVAALAAASRQHDPYLANVLASEAQNRLQRATALARHLGEGAITIGVDGIVTQVNPAAEKLIGIPAERILHRHVHDLLHSDGGRPLHDRSGDCPLLACMRLGSTVRREDDEFSREDGTPIQVAYTASPILRSESADETTGAVIVFQDIGERKAAIEQIRAQQQTIEQVARNALRELNQRKRAEAIFRSLIEVAADAQMLVARDGHITTANPKAVRLFRSKTALEGGQVEDVLPGAREVVRKALDDFQTGAFPLTARRPDGQDFPAEVTSGVVSADGEPLVVLTVRDITARKRAEDARARLAAIVQGSEDAIIGRALDGTITSWNPAAERLYGYKEDEVLGAPADMITPHDAAGSLVVIQDAIRTGRAVEGLDTVRIHKDGRRIPVAINVWPLRDDLGQIVGAAAIHRNLTEVLSARRRLDETTQVLRRIFETTHVGIAYLDMDLRLVRANRAFVETAGLTPPEILGQRLFDLFPDPTNEAIFRRALATGETAQGSSSPHRHSVDGRQGVRYWDWTAQPIHDSEGVVNGLLLTSLDVTAKVRAEIALRESEARFRSVFERGPAGIVIVDEGLRVRDANGAFLAMLGYSHGEVLGRPIAGIVHPDEAGMEPLLTKGLGQADGGVQQEEIQFLSKDGEVVWTEFSTTVVREVEGPPYAIGIVQDVRARKRVEAALREREALFAAVVESGPDAMTLVDVDGIIRVANTQMERLFGYSRAEMLGQAVELLMPEAQRASHANHHRAHYRHNAHVRPMGSGLTVRGRRKDGTEFPVEVSLAPIQLREGDQIVNLVVATIRDASERALKEAAIAREASRLAARSSKAAGEQAYLQQAVASRTAEAILSLHRIEKGLEHPAIQDLLEERGLLQEAQTAAREAAAAMIHLQAAGLVPPSPDSKGHVEDNERTDMQGTHEGED